MTDEQIDSPITDLSPEPIAADALPGPSFADRARRTFTPAFFLRVLAVAGATVAAGVVAALIATVLLLVGGAIDSLAHGANSSAPTSSTVPLPKVDINGVPFLTAVMVVLTSMFFGTVSGSATVGSGSPLAVLGLTNGTAHFGVFAPMLGLLLPVLAVTVLLARRMTPRLPRTSRTIEAAVSGVFVGAALEVLALLGTSSLTVSGLRLEVSVVSPTLFLGGLVATFLAAWTGSSLAAISVGPRRLLPPSDELRRAARTRLGGWVLAPLAVGGIWAACFASAAFVGLVVAAAIKGSATLGFASPVLLGTAAVMAAAIGQLGAVVTESHLGTSGRVAGSETIAALSGATWLWLAVAVAVIAALLSALVLRGMRGRPIWLLPVLAVAAWVVLTWVLATVRADGSLALGALDVSASAAARVSGWSAVVAGLWALAIEALARWVLPAWIEREAAGAGRVRLLSLIVVGALVLVGAAFVIGTKLSSPASAATAYLGRIESGDTRAATAVPGTGSVLPLPAAAADRISNPKVTGVTRSGNEATATVRYDLAGKSVSTRISLRQDGTTALVLPKWVVAAPLVSTVLVDESLTDAVEVAGRPAPGDGASATVRVLPGVYTVTGQGQAAQYVDMVPSRIAAAGTTPVTVTEQATPALVSAIQDEVGSALQTCAASTDAMPSGCPFAAFVFGNYRGLTWTIDDQPTVEISSAGSSWSATGGSATARYEVEDWFDGSYSPTASTVSMYPQFGSFTLTADGVSVNND